MLALPRLPSKLTRGSGFNRNDILLGKLKRSGDFLENLRAKRFLKMKSKKLERLRSRTRTRTANKGVQMQSLGSNGESSTLTVIGKPSRNKFPLGPLNKILSPSSRVTSSSTSGTCGEAVQFTLLLGSHLEASDIGAIFTSLGQTAQADNSGKVFIKTVVGENFMVNAGTHRLVGTIYDCVARHDGFTSVNPDPVSVFNAAGADAQGGTAADETFLGYTPFSSPRFTAAYKIINQTPITLACGEMNRHKVIYHSNKAISLERVTLNGVGPIGGVTVYSFVTFHGIPVHDTATELTITSGECKLDVVRTESISYTQVLQTKVFNSVTTTLATVTGGEQWTMNDPTDTLNAV